MPGDRRHLIFIPLAALVAVLPLILHGCSCGHDFDFHLLSWLEAATQFAHGNFHPHWAYNPAYNAGEPRFVFYPPLSWYLGAAIGLIVTHLPGLSEATAWTATPIVYTWIALTAAGLSMYRLAREFMARNAALLAAVLYLANPYMLFNANERTAYAELLAAAWMPLLLLAILRKDVTVGGLAVPVTLLWLTNAPAAVIGCYTLAFLTVLRVAPGAFEKTWNVGDPHLSPEMRVSRHKSQFILARTAISGTVIGLALAGFYIVPAAYERRWVQIDMATIGGMNVRDNFLFRHTGTSADAIAHDEVLHSISIIAIALIAAALLSLSAAFLLRKKLQPSSGFPYIKLVLLSLGIVFLLTPFSLPLWHLLPQAGFVQFPWRLLIVLAPVGCLAIGAAFDNAVTARDLKASEELADASKNAGFGLSGRLFAGGILALTAAFTFTDEHLYRQPCDQDDAPPGRVAQFHSNLGTEPTDEYTPTDADNDVLAPPDPKDPDNSRLPSNDPPYWVAETAVAPAPKAATPGPVPAHFTLSVTHPEFLILDLRNYPAWRVSLDGVLQRPEQRDDGLIAFVIPAGADTIDVTYAHTPDQTVGDAMTLIAVPIFLFTLRRKP
jgi:hypothetical protein